MSEPTVEHVETLVIGGGQAGLSVGYHLARRGLPFLIVDANERVGDSWRHRWDSLRLFTPARFDGLDGMRFPAPPHYFPSKDEMADFLESYADTFGLQVRSGVIVDKLTRENGRFAASARKHRFHSSHVVVAMSTWQKPRAPGHGDRSGPRDPPVSLGRIATRISSPMATFWSLGRATLEPRSHST